jgi:hypothetical protein
MSFDPASRWASSIRARSTRLAGSVRETGNRAKRRQIVLANCQFDGLPPRHLNPRFSESSRRLQARSGKMNEVSRRWLTKTCRNAGKAAPGEKQANRLVAGERPGVFGMIV